MQYVAISKYGKVQKENKILKKKKKKRFRPFPGSLVWGEKTCAKSFSQEYLKYSRIARAIIEPLGLICGYSSRYPNLRCSESLEFRTS